jgi:hypothetical protein
MPTISTGAIKRGSLVGDYITIRYKLIGETVEREMKILVEGQERNCHCLYSGNSVMNFQNPNINNAYGVEYQTEIDKFDKLKEVRGKNYTYEEK